MQAILPDPKEAVPVLVDSLKHEDDYIRRWAAAFLTELGRNATGPEVGDALEPLTSALKKEAASEVRIYMVRALGEIVAHLKEVPKAPLDQEVVRALIGRLTDVNAGVRRESTASLGKIGAAWRGRGAIREAVSPLLQDLAKGRPFEAEAASALGQIGYTAPLIEALKTAKSERVRAGAARAIALTGPEALPHVPALMAAVKDPDPHVRHEVVLTLGAIGRPAAAAVQTLIGALDDGDYVVPPGAASALGQLGPEAESASAALCKALSSPSYQLRTQAQAALVAIGPAAVPGLRESLKSKDPSVVVLSAQAIGRIGPKARAAIPELVLGFGHTNLTAKTATAEALTVLRAKLPEAVPALALAVGQYDIQLATTAVTLLQELRADTPVVVTAFINRLEQPLANVPSSIELHKLIVRALGHVGPPARSAVPVLIVALDEPALMEDAALSLRLILAPRAGGAELVKSLNEQGQLDERQIALVLGSSTADAVPSLTEFLGHKRVRVRAAAALSLGRLGVRAGASRAALIKALADGNRQVRLNAIDALAQQATAPDDKNAAHKGVLAALDEALNHWDELTRVESALRMVQVALKEPVPALPKTRLPVGVLVAALKHEADPARQEKLLAALKGQAGLGTDLKLAAAMGSEDVLARERIATAIGTVAPAEEDGAAIGSLGKALVDRHGGLRHQAATALSRLARADGGANKAALQKHVPVLEGALKDRDRTIRTSAAIALWRITHESKKALPILLEELELLSYEDGELIERLRTGKPVPPVLVELVNMGEQDEQARQGLVAAMSHDSERVRAGVAVVVGGTKKPPSRLFAPPLALMLEDRNPTIRMQATIAMRWVELGRAQQEQVIRRLQELLDDRNGAVKIQALVTLGVIGPRSGSVKLDHILESVQVGDDLVRARAVEALGRFGPKAGSAIAALQLALKDRDTHVRRAAAASLGEIGAEAVSALKLGLGDRDYDVRVHVARALGTMGPPARDALAALRAASRDTDEDVATAAREAIRKVTAGKID
jgi:HEAT repeat protein